MFSAIAPTYDLLNHLLSLSIDRMWRRNTVRLAMERVNTARGPARGHNGNHKPHRSQSSHDSRSSHDSHRSHESYRSYRPAAIQCGNAPALRILDVATGTGDLAVALARGAESAGYGARVAGVDFAGPMLRIAREKTERLGLGGAISLAEADGHALPFPDAAFDLATIAFGLRNTERPDIVLREMARVVRPGGCVVILEFSEPPNPIFRGLYHFYFHRVLPLVGGAISRSSAYRYLPASVNSFWTMPEFRRHLRGAGLRPVESWWLSGGIAGIHIGRKA